MTLHRWKKLCIQTTSVSYKISYFCNPFRRITLFYWFPCIYMSKLTKAMA